jgi:AAA domain
MLNPDPRFRLRSSQVATEIADHFDAMSSLWAGATGELSYLLTFVPHEYFQTLLNWGWITHTPTSPEGRIQLADRIERDLSRGILVHAPLGADPFVPAGDSTRKRQATALLLGEQAAWFCQPFRPPSAWGTNASMDDVLIIKYVVPRDSARGRRLLADYQRDRFAQRLGAIEVFPYDIAKSALAERRKGRPKWTPLLEAALPTESGSDRDLVFTSAFDWFLDYQETVLRAREYAYELVSEGNERYLVLQLDRARDERRLRSTTMLPLFASSPRRRPNFGDFFKSLVNEDGSGDIEVLADEDGHPGDFASAGRVYFTKRLNDDAIEVVRADTTPRIPQRGWLRPQGDVGDRVAWRRQMAARSELARNKVLIRQLQDPVTIPGFREHWEHAGDGLTGGEKVADILACQPLYALQGPPGTGKTEFAARAIGAYLAREPTARILVSAQSNYALDNLALRVLEHMAERPDLPEATALRLVSNSSVDRADERMRKYFPSELAATRQQELERCVGAKMATAPRDVQAVLARWLSRIGAAGPELTDRLRRSANLVFATCSGAAEEAFFIGESPEPFDWVVVEEAAKAWPTELAIPLIRGLRWTLIGDQKQLPAHRIEEVTQFLTACSSDADPDLRVHGERADEYLSVFRLFEGLFKHDRPDVKGLDRPTGKLATQFRMIDPIGRLISDIFYTDANLDDLQPGSARLPDGWLKTGREAAMLTIREPRAFADKALVWVDTRGMPGHGDEPTWSNQGEVDLAVRLVELIQPRPRPKKDGYTADPLAVLTPYRRQADLLRMFSAVKPYVSTVHAFQGRQADIVLVSLVRDTMQGPPERPGENIGYLTQRELVNVMLSRARELLVLIGDFTHFATCGDRAWAWICEQVTIHGHVIGAEEATR